MMLLTTHCGLPTVSEVPKGLEKGSIILSLNLVTIHNIRLAFINLLLLPSLLSLLSLLPLPFSWFFVVVVVVAAAAVIVVVFFNYQGAGSCHYHHKIR